ncbi:hypothetical protein TREMEDRAFT_60871 [Tremella mesenterica DSM 1558]|uniref:uncharacterized protein n=1 Tax=Tremella mesenterica (strain ATCC 24925 / CBS 8224 / DSM 1558 / NBRC 9311 / NRRL Y-6157 / RJB 2259-6 / UBC 559-6) TaxID=578456 RepID=UPI0003F49F65|nr:uncharacterized protein TREMEDRAFT_60871 [Tremella mesenterica DSM 1558]EIW70377.1 hypothetical protein TREMEDRAFT_60871 [Tremella mesenterica DSM 1558]
MSSWGVDVSLRQGTRQGTTANYAVVIHRVFSARRGCCDKCSLGSRNFVVVGLSGLGLWWLAMDRGSVMVKGGLMMVVVRDVTTWILGSTPRTAPGVTQALLGKPPSRTFSSRIRLTSLSQWALLYRANAVWLELDGLGI